MNTIDQIATLLTEDPDVIYQRAVLAVHPNHVVDAVSAAASVYSVNPALYGPNRLKVLLNYIEKFKVLFQNS